MFQRLKNKWPHIKHLYYARKNWSNKKKVFCIGRNKTGTTSIEKLFKILGIYAPPQILSERLFQYWANNNYEPIIEHVRLSGQGFQDIPYSLPGMYQALYHAFPDSKFILTVRSSSEEWYNSLVKFHSKLIGGGEIPDKQALMNFKHVHKGWIWSVNQNVYKTPEDDPYNKPILIKHYEKYNQDVLDFFSDKKKQLLVINVKDKGAARKISEFLDTGKIVNEMPWENKT